MVVVVVGKYGMIKEVVERDGVYQLEMIIKYKGALYLSTSQP